MSIKVFMVLCVLAVFFSCKKTASPAVNNLKEIKEVQVSHKINKEDISNLNFTEFTLDTNAKPIIANWAEYIELEKIIRSLKQGDLTFFRNNKKAVKLFLLELKTNIPKALNTEALHSRLLVLETKLLQLESLSNLSTTSNKILLATIEEILNSYSFINFSINKKMEFDNRSIEKPQ